MRFSRLVLRRPVFLGNALWACAGGRLRLLVRWSKPDSYTDLVVQDFHRYMFANQCRLSILRRGLSYGLVRRMQSFIVFYCIRRLIGYISRYVPHQAVRRLRFAHIRSPKWHFLLIGEH